ncbi:hypothetical protein IPM65_02045 [Candidatus Roizmanbacteria bacterium]|nr:MAG: hypothetical protein IPM65_02045 [Candidatus Roizmanbacteria bacterium]
MRTPKKTDLFEKIRDFQLTILSKKPASQEMMHEVRMMNFKLRPLSGNVSELDFSNFDFIDALWSLGKLDEFFREEYNNVSDDEKDAFYRLVDDIRFNFQQQLNKANIASIDFEESPKHMFEVEIIKDNNLKIN